jgi:hypothetical protein
VKKFSEINQKLRRGSDPIMIKAQDAPNIQITE